MRAERMAAHVEVFGSEQMVLMYSPHGTNVYG